MADSARLVTNITKYQGRHAEQHCSTAVAWLFEAGGGGVVPLIIFGSDFLLAVRFGSGALWCARTGLGRGFVLLFAALAN